MKQFVLIFSAVMFLANTLVVSAWAKPCMNLADAYYTVEQAMSESGDMPCHENSEQNNQKHCDGVCLCLHVSTTQTPILNGATIKDAPILKDIAWSFADDNMLSHVSAPPHQPPKPYS